MVLSQLGNAKRTEIYLLGMFSIFCFALSIFRMYVTGTGRFFFLNWNLIFAFVPWATVWFISSNRFLRDRKRAILPLIAVWLLFFPN